ncbi:cell death protein Grim [Drosophila kikkawai]|uniref:Cell death protein Grim n=1 Tax=Drosophila kikkawai TaxID=30033 RepID=A0A6P4J6A9_DROKI|nr:cell death protein Grim [Drosophila kikkawai]
MAIAYFIPDQAQLLARSYQQNAQQAATSQRTSSATPTQQPGQQAQQQPAQEQQQQEPRQAPHRPQFRANISVPLGRQQGSMTMSEFGCWDLLAQIFCYALRIYSYNSSQRRPTVIQISFEISGGSQDSDDDVTDASASKDN